MSGITFNGSLDELTGPHKGYNNMELLVSIARGFAHFLTSPLNVFFLFLTSALLLKLVFRSRTAHWIAASTGIGWMLWCSLPVTSNLMLRPVESTYPIVHAQSANWRSAQAIVVLACQHNEDPVPFSDKWHECSLKRNLQTLMMYQTHPVPIYLTGGILKENQQSEAEANKAFFRALGVPEHHLLSIPQGTNTHEEAIALGQFLSGKNIALVTSASHQIRAVRYLNYEGIKTIPVPVEFLSVEKESWGLPRLSYLKRSERAIYEWFGLLHQYLALGSQATKSPDT
ncbi:YdcF family protein [Aliiglaciecola sp. CAU 1673]|uniref:YdcF family protein n=1 Tax=Aliiglaciecola sp. CAU 1673 TaxID=3032595 RepID=UPI0023DB0B9A|nr:YdcF family protein [Aliiglaciecola sp. CAU 1673]MDF2177324.1 YdcF family protein [Aliiglaciecola sp. CAU 1673]